MSAEFLISVNILELHHETLSGYWECFILSGLAVKIWEVELDRALLRQGLLIPHFPGQRPHCPRSTQTPSGLEVFGVAGEPGPA